MMASKTLTETIALTEKKMDMTLDDIIRMSKKNVTKGRKPQRASNKSRGFLNARAAQANSKVQRFMDSRSSVRQGVLAQRRSNFQGQQFPVTRDVARKAAVMPSHNRAVNWIKPRVAVIPLQTNNGKGSFAGKDKVVPKQRPQTLDARFAGIKEQRMRVMSQQQMVRSGNRQTVQRRRIQQQQQGRGVAPGGIGRRFTNFSR